MLSPAAANDDDDDDDNVDVDDYLMKGKSFIICIRCIVPGHVHCGVSIAELWAHLILTRTHTRTRNSKTRKNNNAFRCNVTD